MSLAQRRKGQRIENAIVHLHHDAGIACEKLSRAGYTGADIRIADVFSGEVKSRGNGAGFALLSSWLGIADFLFLKRDRQQPLVVLSWERYTQLLRGYLHGGDGHADTPTP
jgi:hypothetical protein